MAETGKAAVYVATGEPMEIREYPVPEPEPGAILIKVTRANICGSDLHQWRGDVNLTALGAPLPAIVGHEMMGKVAKLGDGVVADSAGQPLAVGDRVVHRYFRPCGHCRACMKGRDESCPMAPLAVVTSVDEFPHFTGVYAEYYYAHPNQTVFKVPDNVTDDMAAPANCALSQVIHGLERVGFSFGETIAIQGAGGLGLYATAVAKDMGAAKVIVIDGIDERLELAKAFGADELIDIREITTPLERWLKVKELTDGWGADVVAELPEDVAQSVLESIPAEDSAEVRELLRHEEDTAGGLMQLELVSVPEAATVDEAIQEVRRHAGTIEHIYNVYGIDEAGRLIGVLSVDRLLAAAGWMRIGRPWSSPRRRSGPIDRSSPP